MVIESASPNPDAGEPHHDVPSGMPGEQSQPDSNSAGAPFLDSLVEATTQKRSLPGSRLDDFLNAKSVGQALHQWFGREIAGDKEWVARRLNRDIGEIDRLLTDQVNQILHAKPFQELEASWRGLHYLTNSIEPGDDLSIKVRVLQASRKDLEKDFERALEFDQSELFRQVYENEFGMAGGEPFGVILADFEVQPRPTASHPYDDMSFLNRLAEVGAAAFCPIVVNADPAMFGMDDFSGMQYRVDHAKTFAQTNYLAWRRFRESDHARFIGLTMPRVLMRPPYGDDGTRIDRFCFHEDVSGPDNRKYLWGGANYAFGEVLIRAFSQAGWLADIRGVTRDELRGGIVTGLPTQSFATEKIGVTTKISTDVVIPEELERQLGELGFIPLCSCQNTDYSAFYSNHSVQKPRLYDRPEATANAKISSMLQYMLCVSRFAHYIKCMGRDKTGSFVEASEFESFLQNWIVKYVTADSEANPNVKSRHPLRDAQVQVYAIPGKPGSFNCTLHLSPHYELDNVHASIRLQAELTTNRSR